MARRYENRRFFYFSKSAFSWSPLFCLAKVSGPNKFSRQKLSPTIVKDFSLSQKSIGKKTSNGRILRIFVAEKSAGFLNGWILVQKATIQTFRPKKFWNWILLSFCWENCPCSAGSDLYPSDISCDTKSSPASKLNNKYTMGGKGKAGFSFCCTLYIFMSKF